MEVLKFYICDEMQKLRDILDKHGIPWQDVSDKGSDIDPFWICRTHFNYKFFCWSVVHGYGTYGGLSTWNGSGGELLEVMSNAVNGGEPIGSQTAEGIWSMMQEVEHE